MTVSRHFTSVGEDPYDFVEWQTRSAKIANENGEIVFEQTDVEVPKTWSQLATNVVASKYFRGHIGTPEREHSVRQLIDRVVGRIHHAQRHQLQIVPVEHLEQLEQFTDPVVEEDAELCVARRLVPLHRQRTDRDL